MSNETLDPKLLEEYKELTDGEPVKPNWTNEDLEKANKAIKKAREIKKRRKKR